MTTDLEERKVEIRRTSRGTFTVTYRRGETVVSQVTGVPSEEEAEARARGFVGAIRILMRVDVPVVHL